jgi:hypothetical protein
VKQSVDAGAWRGEPWSSAHAESGCALYVLSRWAAPAESLCGATAKSWRAAMAKALCVARGKRYGRPPHTGVPKIGGRPYHSPRDVLGGRLCFGGHRRQIALLANACLSEDHWISIEQRLCLRASSAKNHAVDAVHKVLDRFSPPAPAQWLALAADDFGYFRMRRPPKTAAARVHTSTNSR